MPDLRIIAERINSVFLLSAKNEILLSDIDIDFRRDLLKFIQGETLSTRDGQRSIGHNLYKKWLQKLRTKGFDYSIDFSK